MNSRRNSAWQWAVTIAAALLFVACETPKLERDAFYPADWPDFTEIGADCAGLDGRYANRGRYVDGSGKAADSWLTDILAAMPTPREAAPLVALHVCERVALRVETYPHRIRSDFIRHRLVAVPQRGVGGAPEQWADCDTDVQLPRGQGYPFESVDAPTYERGSGSCLSKRFMYVLEKPAGMGWTAPLALEVARGTDGSLIVKVWRGGSPSPPLAWARFPKAP